MKMRILAAAALLLSMPLVSSSSSFADGLDNERALLNNLSPEGQRFFVRSMEIRSEMPENDAYKHFQRDRDGDGKIDVMDKDGYLHLHVSYNGYNANPAFYGGPAASPSPVVFYRYVKDCKTHVTIERQIIETDGSYGNFVGGDRYEQQCVMDGTMDEYYVESADKLDKDVS